jgi:peptidoglycan hydrolase CwlO-like protein
MFEDSFYKNWRRQKKNYEMEIKSLNEKIKQMQEKLDSLQQKQLQGDLARGRNAINKSKFNKFDHVNMEIVSRFCKNKISPHLQVP